MMENGERIALKADPNDPEDFDVSEAGLAQALAEREERRAKSGRPRGSDKELVSIRLDKATLEHFRARGPGWQTRMNEVLRQAAGL